MSRRRRAAFLTLGSAAFVVLSCGTDTSTPPVAEAHESGAGTSLLTLTVSTSAIARLGDLRARFVVESVESPTDGRSQVARAQRPLRVPVLGVAIATGFARSDAGSLRALLPARAKQAAARPAIVELPHHADGESYLEDPTSGLSVRFRLRDASAAVAVVADGYALYGGALVGADLVHRVHVEGTEDYVVFETRPAEEVLHYDVDVSRVSGLRLVSNTLEFLDQGGSPGLRIAPPYVVDGRGVRRAATLEVSRCLVDTNSAAPWGRPVTPPGAQRCTVDVAWNDVTYPAIVDPAWGTTGSMATPRANHTATILPSGKVLIAGGQGNGSGLAQHIASAELFDPTANAGVGAFAAAGSMTAARQDHTARLLPSGKVLIAGGYGHVEPCPIPCAIGALGSAEIYDPAANAGAGGFTATGSMATVRRYHVASVLNSGKVLIAGGYSMTGPLAGAELFDAAANGGVGAFAATGPMAAARYYHASSVLPSGKVLVVGGSGSGYLASAELFDPAAAGGVGAFAPTGPLGTARDRHTATLLPAGKVLVAGGYGGAYVANAELFDPAAGGGVGAFAVAGSMVTGRALHTATLLPSGKVLIAGGNGGTILASAELFAPGVAGGVGVFANAGTMTTARQDHTASLLATGKVLVTGGLSAGYVASAEVFGGTLGEACTSGYCLSGFCVDGFCCDTACGGGGCDRCDLPGTKGTCTLAPPGDPGVNAACLFPLACDGASAACPTSCTSDAACAPAYYCAPNGTCLARKAQAAACNTQTDCATAGCRECASGNCVDGFCCDTACSGTCQACVAALKQSGLGSGTCGPIKDGIDPRSECAPAGVLCGPDGLCNGAGACRLFTPPSASCGAGTCQGTVARGDLCDGAGSCAANPTGVECSPFLCANGGCTTSCVTSADCAADGWCTAGKCEKRSGDGKACTLKEQCLNNICADGVCCNAPCGKQCEACNVPGAEGTCAPVSGAPHLGHPACAQGTPDKPCSTARCDGTERNGCSGFVDSSVVCGTASCTQGTAIATGTCDGQGACQSPAPRRCVAFACGATACNETCTKDADCAPGNTCDVTSSKCVSAATCDDDHTARKLDGTTQNCTPYRCDSNGACPSECISVADCVAPALCDQNHKCVLPAADDSGGCSVAPARRATDASAFFAASAVAIVLALRRRQHSSRRLRLRGAWCLMQRRNDCLKLGRQPPLRTAVSRLRPGAR